MIERVSYIHRGVEAFLIPSFSAGSQHRIRNKLTSTLEMPVCVAALQPGAFYIIRFALSWDEEKQSGSWAGSCLAVVVLVVMNQLKLRERHVSLSCYSLAWALDGS